MSKTEVTFFASPGENRHEVAGSSVPTTNQVVDRLRSIGSANDASDLEGEVRRLALAIAYSANRFRLFFVVVNRRDDRDKRVRWLKSLLQSDPPVEIELTGSEENLLETLWAAPGGKRPLFVFGIERLISSDFSIARRRTLHEFQLRREQFRRLGRPLVIWMPEYVYSIIGKEAVDFWSWQSGGFFLEAGEGSAWAALDLDSQPNRSVSTLPASTADFTGREAELAHLADILAAGGRAGISAVTGMGGIGKTALAVEAAQRAADSFPDGILFLDLGGFGPNPLAPEAALANLIAQVAPALTPPQGLAQLSAAYRSLLAGRRMLLLLDNARDAAQLRPLLPPEPVALLATSRAPLRLPGVQPLALDALPEAEARALLRSALHGRAAGEADLSAIAAACARLPIALRAAGAFLAEHPGWAIADYLAALANKRLPHLASEDDPALDVAAVLGFSVERLAAERPALAQRWRLLSIFPGDFATDAAAAVWSAEPRDVADDLGHLDARSLLLHDTATGRWRLHDLYRELAAEGADVEAVEAARERHAEHFLKVLWKIDSLYKTNGRVSDSLALYDLEWPNIEAAQAWAAASMATRNRAAHLVYEYINAGAQLFDFRLSPQRKIIWMEAALRGCQQTANRKGEGAALMYLGLAWEGIGNAHAAIEYYNRALAMFVAIGELRGEAATLGNLGNAWNSLGEHRKAISLLERRLAIALEIGDKNGEANALGNLGLAWADLGEIHKAIEFHEQDIAIRRQVGDRRREAEALGNLGIARKNLGETRKAIELYEQQLAIAHEIGDRRGEGNALGNLGITWGELGETRKAIEFYEQQLAIAREIGDRRGEGNALGNLGLAWKNLGETRKAIEFYEQQLVISRDIDNPRGEGLALANLGKAWQSAGDIRRAIELFERALAISRRASDPRREAEVLTDLGDASALVGDFRRSIKYYEEAMVLWRRLNDRQAEARLVPRLEAAQSEL